MNKILVFICIIVLSAFGASCVSQNTISVEKKGEKILNILEEKNKEKIINLFSKDIQKMSNFDEKIDQLCGYFNGKILSYQKDVAELEEETSEIDMYEKKLGSTYNIETTEGIYRIAVNRVVENTKNTNAIGIESFYIIKAQESDLEYAYWGDGKFTPGIHIDVTE